MRGHRSLFPLVSCALWALVRADGPPDVTWSVVDATGASATLGDGKLVEICSLEELHVRVDAAGVRKAAILPHLRDVWTHVDGSTRAHVATEILRVDGVEDEHAVALHDVDLEIWEQDEVATSKRLFDDHARPIECAFDPDFCVPKIVGIRLPDVVADQAGATLAVNHSIVLQFAAPTNQPDARTREAIEAFVAFPAYVGDDLQGAWPDDKTLVIRVTALDETLVLPLQSLMASLVHTTLRLPERATRSSGSQDKRVARIQTALRLRIQPEGEYVVRLQLGEIAATVQSPIVRVHRCRVAETEPHTPLLVVLEDELHTSVASSGRIDQTSVPPTPQVFIDGVLTHSGSEAFTLRHSAIEMDEPGSWSLNFWLFTDQDATGTFRTLFFNGNGSGEHRTASAWFRPDDRRLVLRVSTVTNMDVGLDSASEIPTNEWVNIGVTLTNCSTGAALNSSTRPDCMSEDEASKPWLYSLKLFVNGALDQDVRLFTPVLPNDGPLHLADSPWTDGLRGFTSQIRVFGHSIRDVDHRLIFSKGKNLYRSFSSREDCDTAVTPSGASRPPKGPLHPAQQVSYWAHCMAVESDFTNEPHPTATLHNVDDTTASSIYNEAVRLRSLCDPSSWDLLKEASELGDARALRDVGAAYVYGWLAFSGTDCANSKIDGVLLDADHDRASEYLLRALSKKEWGAARALATLHTYNHSASSRLQLGLYHWAAAAGGKDAFMVLGRLYANGDQIPCTDSDVAAYHYFHAASAASAAYHARGKQPLHEMNRLYDGVEKEDELRKGQLGDDDELIQYQKMRADKDGDVEAMANMGDLYYWGARGLPRDHEQAYNYFHRAADRGHTSAQSAVAGMLLKGEGTKQDNASAIEWYEKAALKNHTRALNGLGFIHFYGSGGLAENKTRALEYFERAAANMEDGDSVFNAGYCHAHGLGAVRNMTRATEYFESAARKFGHFDAIHELGKLYWNGWEDPDNHATNGSISRDSGKAITYLKAACEAGTWGRSVRTGFEFFLAGDFERATVVYTEASEYGYRVATSNLAYLYDQKLLRIGNEASEQRALHQLHQAYEHNGDKEALVRIGDFYYYGWGGVQADPFEALHWYSRASAAGVDTGAYNVGHMYEYGLGVPINYERAERYYRRVVDLAEPQAFERHVAIQLALARLRFRRWIEGSPLAWSVLDQGSALGGGDDTTPLALLPGQQDGENDMRRSIVTITTIAAAVVVASLGAWWMRRRV